MATGEVVIGSDGELAIMVGPWAKDKLHYIRRYCYIFNMGMKDKWAVRTYIDLFSGPGICVVENTKEEIEGSPIIALNCKVPFTQYYFNDVQKELVEALKSRSKNYSVEKYYHSNDCNLVIDDILKELPPPSTSLDFCFIDPLNWEINFNSIRKLTSNRRMDLAITFHIGNIKRVANNPPKELISFFPEVGWQKDYAKSEENNQPMGRMLLDSYERGLTELGYKEIKDYILETNTKKVPLYYLIFASKHPRGADFWEKITERSHSGQMRMKI